MNGFPTREQSENMGGVIEFYFARVRDICTMPELIGAEYDGQVKFVNGENWKYGYSAPYKMQLDESSDITEVGYVFKKPFVGFYPMQSKEALELFMEMEGEYFIIKMKDANSRTRLIGDLEAPLVFKYDPVTGSDNPNLAGYIFQFLVDEKKPAPFYENEDTLSGSFSLDYNEDYE